MLEYRHTLFYFASQIVLSLQTEVLWQPWVKQVFFFFPTALAHFVFLSHFGDSHNISAPPPAKRLQLTKGSDDG